MKDTHGIRRVWALLLAGLLLISAVPAMADTEGFVDLEEPCSVTVSASNSQDADFIADLKQANVQIDLYLVAKAVKQQKDEKGEVIKDVTGYDTYIYQLEEPFAKIVIPEGTAADPKPTPEEWRAIADEAGAIILGAVGTDNALKPAATGKAGEQIKDLEPGLYAIVAHGDIAEYVKEITAEAAEGEDPVTSTVTIANSDVFEYQFQVELISLPTKEAPEGGNANTADTTPWIYDAQATMKPARIQRLGDLLITKQLDTYKAVNDDYEPAEAATFIFEVTVDNTEYDPVSKATTSVYMLNFFRADTKQILIKDLPAGALVTVTEAYSGASYKLVAGDRTQEKTIIAEDIVEAFFENDFRETPDGGYGILNEFVMTESGWKWRGVNPKLDNETVSEEVAK